MNKPLVVVDASVALAWHLPDTTANLWDAADVREAQADNHIIFVNGAVLRACSGKDCYRTRRITAIEWFGAAVLRLATG